MQRYDRDKLLGVVDEVTTYFRMPAGRFIFLLLARTWVSVSATT
jgi:hypothetical protein